MKTLMFAPFATALLLLLLAATPSFADTGNGVIDPSAMDLNVDPCTDFYQYSCGNWLKRTTIPSDQADWARSFSVIYEQNLATLNTVLVDYSNGKNTPPTPYSKKLGDFYASCMNEKAVDDSSKAALASQLAILDKFQDKKQLPNLLANLHLNGVGALFSFSSTGDLKNPTLETAEVDQGGLGLPSSTTYTSDEPANVAIRAAYKKHIANLFRLAGVSAPEANADAVFALELSLALNALPPEKLQDPTKVYHPLSPGELGALTPSFDWPAYFHGLAIKPAAITNVTEPKFMAAVEATIKGSDVATLRTYLKLHLIETLAPSLGKDLYAESFDFNGRILNGQKEPSPRWKTCVSSVSRGMSEALGQAFVAKTFSPNAKARAETMIANLRLAFKQDLQSLDWLDDPTRAAALEKLQLITQKIGYPDKFRNYDYLNISRASYWLNAQAARRFENHRQFNKIGGKVDPTEWGMSPQTVNAYYDPNVNQINFPAGILQPPFFSESADDASNYGSIGMVIGHEMTQGFDTTGSQFDGHGAEKDWWSAGVKATFQSKAQCLIDQYSGYEALPGLKVNGALTITENIADQGGLKLGFAAYKLAMAGKPVEAPIGGLNPEQQYFVAMGQNWCDKQTDESLRQQVTGDPHSPAKFRVIGTMVNNPDFARAFSCNAGTPMAPVNRCSIW
ncbi:MAG: M13 family metallopeptidase [Bdellovibrionota bacterium]